MVPSSSLIEGVAWYSGTGGLAFFAGDFAFVGGSLRFIGAALGRPRVAYCLVLLHTNRFAAAIVIVLWRKRLRLRKVQSMRCCFPWSMNRDVLVTIRLNVVGVYNQAALISIV